MRDPAAGRCDPYQHDVIAVSDGMILRDPGDEALYLIVDRPGEHIRFRYLHMDPHMLDAAGMINGRVVSAGEVLGAVDTYGRHQGGTSYHLHFNVQVFTRDGWVFVNPYMTLVAAYERLIGGRGQVVRDVPRNPEVATPGVAALPPDGGSPPPSPENQAAKLTPPDAIVALPKTESASEGAHEHDTASAERCETRGVKGHRRRVCERDHAQRGGRRHRVRSVDRGVSR
jgi:hypothetical protein